MSRHSCIRHPAEGRYVKRREDYVEICEGNTCAAELLDLFEYWTNCKLERLREIQAFNDTATRLHQPTMNLPSLWLYERIQDLKAALIGGFAETSIKKSLKLLKDKGFLRDKPSPTKFDNTRLYLFCISSVQSAIDDWHKTVTAETSEKLDQTETSDDQTKTTLDETETSLDETNITVDEIETSHISNTHSSLLSQNQKTPPTPSEEERGGELEIKEKEKRQEESGIPTQSSLPEQPCQPSNSNNDKTNHGDKDSAGGCDNSSNSYSTYCRSSAAKNDAMFQRPKLDLWLDKPGLNHWKPEFVEFYRKHLSSTRYYREDLRREATAGDARNSLIGLTKSDEGRAQIQNHWENYQASLAPKPTESLLPRRDPLEGTEPIRPEFAQELRKIANLARSQKK